MASQEEDNKLECKANVNKEQERNFVSVYKKYDCIFNNKNETFEKKIDALIEVWKSVGDMNHNQSDIRYVIQIMDWAKLHALDIVLTAEWKDYKAKYEARLLNEIEKAQGELLKINSAFSTRCQKLADVVRNPWEDPVLERLLAQKEAKIGPEEIEFFCVESAYLVSVRLKKLCDSQCEDLALNLVTAFMTCNSMSKSQNFTLNATETQMWFIFDIYIALLYKFQENSKIVALLKELSLEEGYQLMKRFAKKRVKISKIWKHCQRIAVLASQVFVSTAAVKFSEEHRQIVENIVEGFISICNTDALMETFTSSLRRISQLADAAGLYVFCDVVHRKAGLKLKPFTIEMYIRALTTDMNNLERQKNDNDSVKAAETTKRLAGAFCKLADLLDEHVKVTRECVLTAFSLEPTLERLRRIEDLARRSGLKVLDTGQDWKCKLHPPALPSDDVSWICSQCGDWMSKPQLNIPLTSTNTALNEALQAGDLGISPQLCDDLAVCLSNPRYQVLSWLLPWENLQRICVMYCNDPERTKNIVTELKFIDIDYSIFNGIKREPVDEMTGIERGYERYLDQDFASDDQMSTVSEDSASQESRPYSLGSDGAGEVPCLAKSDPNTLKSLRMFRPAVKRAKKVEIAPVPEKMYKFNNKEKNYGLAGNMQGLTSIYNAKSLYNYSPGQFQVGGNVEPVSKNGLAATLPPLGGQVALNKDNFQNLSTREILNQHLQKKLMCKQPSGLSKSGTLEGSGNDTSLPNKLHSFSQHSQLEDNSSKIHLGTIFNQGSLVQHRQAIQVHPGCPQDPNPPNKPITKDSTIMGKVLTDQVRPIDPNSKCNNFTDGQMGWEFFLKDRPKSYEVMPKAKSTDNKLGETEDCVTTPKEGDQNNLSICRNVNKGCEAEEERKLKRSKNVEVFSELRIVLCRMDDKVIGKFIKGKRGRRRKSSDNFENQINKKAPRRVQNYKLSPLQDINPRVSAHKMDSLDCDDPLFEGRKKTASPEFLDLRVMLERLPNENRNYARSVLANVPGLNDFGMIRPNNVNHIVNVVQISGGRPNQAQNTQTSTQVSPHIQRIGQPRSDKPETVSTETTSSTTASTTSTTTSIKPATSQPSTLINILSQQISRPGQSNCATRRSSPLINILSQQQIKPATSTAASTASSPTKITNSVVGTEAQVNNVTKVTASDGGAKPAVTTHTVKNVITPTTQTGTILQFICKSTLPKFQQAFGKSVYQNSTETAESTVATTEPVSSDESKKTQAKNIPLNVQPIQGGVIYTRQMPVGQTINLIPPGRGQVFRIATSNAEQISLMKDTVIHSKMSALLAAALQGKPKAEAAQVDGEVPVEDASGSNRVAVAKPALVQNARIKPVIQIPSNVIRSTPQQASNLSSTTLEQLREFDMVYKQIKERSSSTPAESTSPESTEGNAQQRISVTYVNQGQKFTQLSPVVVVSSYCNLQPAASPALSVTSQGSSSPCVTPAPTPTLPKVAAKSSKGKTLKNANTINASKASPIPKPQQKPQEDEHTTQRIFDILAEYAEQLRNSPDLNNKPAPRRRSNPPTNPSQNSKRKKSSSSKTKTGQNSAIPSEADTEDQRTMGSEDSSCGVVQLSVPDEEQQNQVTTSESNDSNTSNSRQLILTSEPGNNQTRNLIIADSSVGEALKMPNTAVLVPGNYIMPVSMVKGGQQIAVVSGGSKILATVPARSGPNMLLFQSFLNQNRKTGVPTVKYSTIQPISGISSQSLAGVSAQPPVILPSNSHNLTAVTLGQPITLKKMDENDRVNTELLLTISQPRDGVKTVPEPTVEADPSTEVKEEQEENYQKPPIQEDTKVPDSSILNIPSENIKEEAKVERVQSVLVACTSNGPMLSHTPPRYRKASETNHADSASKGEFVHNGDKHNSEQKHFQANSGFYQNKAKKVNPQRLDKELHQLSLQRKQAAIERELRLQKSLSEECEDLGVDEPSTSDLFPEADLLFDSNHSPSFDQTSQDLLKRPQGGEVKEEAKNSMTLFSDDDNSSLRTDLFEYVEYPAGEGELVFQQNQQMTNGQSSTSNESASSCEDNTLLQNCASMSDVTLNSPLSPHEMYQDGTGNKYKYKYINKKKGEKVKQEGWGGEVSSSEDTTGSTELGKSNSPEPCNKRSHSISCDEELSDGSYKVVRVAISKTDFKDEESCEELHCEEDSDCSPSGRGARRSVKKTCSCCNGSQGASRKRPTSRPHTPSPHKKAFTNKKR